MYQLYLKKKARGNDKKHGKKDLDRNVTKLDFAEKSMNIEQVYFLYPRYTYIHGLLGEPWNKNFRKDK